MYNSNSGVDIRIRFGGFLGLWNCIHCTNGPFSVSKALHRTTPVEVQLWYFFLFVYKHEADNCKEANKGNATQHKFEHLWTTSSRLSELSFPYLHGKLFCVSLQDVTLLPVAKYRQIKGPSVDALSTYRYNLCLGYLACTPACLMSMYLPYTEVSFGEMLLDRLSGECTWTDRLLSLIITSHRIGLSVTLLIRLLLYFCFDRVCHIFSNDEVYYGMTFCVWFSHTEFYITLHPVSLVPLWQHRPPWNDSQWIASLSQTGSPRVLLLGAIFSILLIKTCDRMCLCVYITQISVIFFMQQSERDYLWSFY